MATQQEINELKDKIALSCRVLGRQGLTKGALGHVSARIPGEPDKFLIKAKGPDETALEFATVRDVITIDDEGATIEAPEGLQPPNETAMHLAVYRKRPEVQSVIHAHPDYVVLLTAVEKPLVPIYSAYGPGVQMAIDGVPLYPRSITIVNDELGDDFMSYMGQNDVCMLRGHGITTAGMSVEESTSNAFAIHELARMNYMAYAIGDPKSIPQQDIDEMARRRESGRGGTRPSNVVYDRFASAWKYYKQLLGEWS
ncbi:MAG: 3,4-dihydroxyphthalate decarboxylase [Chloroflexota bacterium]|jgi:ribulose-5-phosphate 4-epimerase/fuculose-1-phosphate aldolase|nr:3,4-dihydroxyphthalate decarboxylase [Chloroflexota bacterium]